MNIKQIENKLEDLDYEIYFEGIELRAYRKKIFGSIYQAIVVKKSEEKLEGYVFVETRYISTQDEINTIQIAFNRMQADLEDLRVNK